MIETVEDCVKWYWQGFDAFAKMDVPLCPYADGDAKCQWWLGYDDAESEHSQSLDVVCERCNSGFYIEWQGFEYRATMRNSEVVSLRKLWKV